MKKADKNKLEKELDQLVVNALRVYPEKRIYYNRQIVERLRDYKKITGDDYILKLK